MRAYLREVSESDVETLSDCEQLIEHFHWKNPAVLNLEKAWDGLHRLLIGAGPQAELGFLQKGGTEIGPDIDYGRARLFSSEFVGRLNQALNAMSDDQFWAGFDPQRFEADQVYPWIWDEDPEELREEYVFYLRELKKLIGRVAASGGQVAIVIL
jgi:hypothetical protein